MSGAVACTGPPEVSLLKREQNVLANQGSEPTPGDSGRGSTADRGLAVITHAMTQLGATDQKPWRGGGLAVNSAQGMEAQPTTQRLRPRERRDSSRDNIHSCEEIR